MQKVLFLCTHNSCRSQMAEGIVNHYLGDRFQAYSAGTEATRVNPLAIQVLAELGIDISGHRAKTLDEFAGARFDHVITLCGSANDQCPLFIGEVHRVHIGFDDPSRATGSPEEILREFRRVRDEIKERLLAFFVEKVDSDDGARSV
ncbi:MAG: arsenate [Geobacteraceae bacterium]|nr:MAG: arsenate [Geobacteraceae bacterium]